MWELDSSSPRHGSGVWSYTAHTAGARRGESRQHHPSITCLRHGHAPAELPCSRVCSPHDRAARLCATKQAPAHDRDGMTYSRNARD